MNPAKLRLYTSPHCGYCRLVLREAEKARVALEVIDIIDNPEVRERLVRSRGRGTVPVLGILRDDQEILMGESKDIIRYIRARASEPTVA